RSPMAQGLLHKMIREKYLDLQDQVEVATAGLYAMKDEPASKNALTVMREMAIDLSTHRARRLTAALVDESDMIITMTRAHKTHLLNEYPQYADKIMTLYEAGGRPPADVQDPFGSGIEVYRQCRDEISGLLEAIIESGKISGK
ncbi:MAG: low molecular weight protein arginine phosphatase, partial [Candidatus Saccharibacteria bacterium]